MPQEIDFSKLCFSVIFNSNLSGELKFEKYFQILRQQCHAGAAACECSRP